MVNVKHFRNSELVNSFYEFSKRLNMPENQEIKNSMRWTTHVYFKFVFKRVLLKMPTLNVSGLISIMRILYYILLYIYFFLTNKQTIIHTYLHPTQLS